MEDFDKGQRVEVRDGSYSFLIETGEHLYGSLLMNRVWRIVDFIPMKPPPGVFHGLVPMRDANDCVIVSEDEARQRVSIQSRFLVPLVKHCPTCRCNFHE